MRLERLVLSMFLCFAGALGQQSAAQTVYSIGLDQGQEVPPTGSAATGSCVLRLDEAETELRVICSHNVSSVTMAHIHNAAAGVNGPIVFPFSSATSPFRGVWALSAADVVQLQAGNLYVNVHSTTFPGGEIRGQILAPAHRGFSFALDQSEEVPPTGSAATGGCDAALNMAETSLITACFHNVAGVTMAHIHNAAPGVNGPIVFPFPSATSPFIAAWALGASGVDELLAGDLYVNVHSGAFPAGEIRGQMVLLPFFEDGFESGDTSGWSAMVPP